MRYIVTIEPVEEEQPRPPLAESMIQGWALMFAVLIRMAFGLGAVVLILVLISLG